MATKELTTTNYNLTPIDPTMMDAIKEEMEGLGQIPFDVIKIPSGGGIAFEVPGDDPENPDIEKAVEGVIVVHHPMNSFWADEYAGGSSAPDCASMDGRCGLDSGSGEVVNCATCPRNQFGSGSDGAGKACKNLHRLYILRAGEMLPVILNLPPTSIKNFKNYLAKRVVMRGRRLSQVVTKITLTKAQSAGGISYSQAQFALAAVLTDEQAASLQPTIQAVNAMRSSVPVAPEAAETATAPQTVEFTEIKDDGAELPF